MAKPNDSENKTAQPDDTIENRVYLFESLARAFVEKSADDLGSKNEDRRARALRGLADLAYVSCVVADGSQASPKAVRRRILSAAHLDEAQADAPDPSSAE